MRRLIEFIKRLWNIPTISLKLEHRPPVQPVQSPPEVAEKTPDPDGEGWYREPWGRWRPVKGGMGSSVEIDDEPPGNSLTINNPFNQK